jgi:hypothetical protein
MGLLLAKGSGLQSKFVARHEPGPDVSDHRASERKIAIAPVANGETDAASCCERRKLSQLKLPPPGVEQRSPVTTSTI